MILIKLVISAPSLLPKKVRFCNKVLRAFFTLRVQKKIQLIEE